MKIKGVSEAKIREIAEWCGFKLQNVRSEGNFTAFVLRLGPAPSVAERRWLDKHDMVRLTPEEALKYRNIAERLKYRKLGSDMARMTPAVCFHGHKYFMEQIFKHNPEALIVTCVARYEGCEDFAAKWAGVGMQGNVATCGPAYQGNQYREMCNCYGG